MVLRMFVTLPDASRYIAGVVLLTVTTIEFGGWFMTRIVRGKVPMTPFQTAFARAGHGHAGVLVILMHGDLTKLSNIEFNRGDLIFIVALVIFGLYSVLSLKRPDIHALSFVAFTFGAGAACLIPLFIWELFTRPLMQIDTANLLTLFYVALFPSTLAYLCFNRGVQLIGANRAAPFFHVVPVFGTVMSIAFLGEHPQAFQFIGFALVLTGVFVASRKASA